MDDYRDDRNSPAAEPARRVEEESSAALPNSSDGAPLSTASADHRSTARPEGEVAAEHVRGGVGSPAGDKWTIIRATTRLRVDFRRFGDDSDRPKALCAELFGARKRVVTAANYLARKLWTLDGATLNEFQDAHKRLPKKGKEWPMPKLKNRGYNDIRGAVPELAGGVASALAKYVSDKWSKERWDAFIWQVRSPPHFRETMPIPVRSQDYRLIKRDDGWWLRLLLTSKELGGEALWIPIEIRDKFQRLCIEHIAAGAGEVAKYRADLARDRVKRKKDGDNDRKKGVAVSTAVSDENWAPGELKLEQDRKRPSRWYVRISYKRRISPSTGTVTMAVNRGIRSHLVAVTSDGESWIYDGSDIESYLKKLQARRKQYQRDAKACARGGRGRKRILRPIEPLIAKGERWRQTKCQVIARQLAKWARERGVSVVYLEDLSGIRRGEPERLEGGERIWKRVQEWPFYQQAMRLESCLREYGIETKHLPAWYISQRCPECGHVAKEQRDLRHWMLRCTKCSYRRHLDEAACANLLARAQAEAAGDDSEFRALDEKGKKATRPRRRGLRNGKGKP